MLCFDLDLVILCPSREPRDELISPNTAPSSIDDHCLLS